MTEVRKLNLQNSHTFTVLAPFYSMAYIQGNAQNRPSKNQKYALTDLIPKYILYICKEKEIKLYVIKLVDRF